MATTYEDAAQFESVLKDSDVSADVKDAIVALLDGNASFEELAGETTTTTAEVVAANVDITTASQVANAKAIVMGGDAVANVVFGSGAKVETLVLAANDDNGVALTNSNAINVELQGGANNSVVIANDANNVVTINGTVTNANLITGTGADNFVLTTNAGDAVSATINAGQGFDQVTVMDQTQADHTFEFDAKSGQFVMHSDGGINMNGIGWVVFDTDANGEITAKDQVTILAGNEQEAMAAKLYQVALGRQPIDNGGWSWTDADLVDDALMGYVWWTNEYQMTSVTEMVEAFVGTQEAQAYLSGSGVAAKIFSNLGATSIGGQTAAQYDAMLESGEITVAGMVQQIVTSNEIANLLGNDGSHYMYEGF